MSATLSLSSAHDADLASGGGSSSVAPLPVAAIYSSLSTALSFSQKMRQSTFAADAAAELRRYPDQRGAPVPNYSASAGLTTDLSRSTSIRARVDGRYISDMAFGTFTTSPQLEPSDPGSGLHGTPTDWTMTTYGAGAGLTRTWGRRSSVTVSYDGRYGERQIVGDQNVEQAATLQFAQNGRRDASVRVSYTYRNGTQRSPYGFRRHFVTQDVQLGLERRWRRSASRNTVIALSAGPSLLRDEAPMPEAGGPTGMLGAVGSVMLRHDLRANWNIGMSYFRGAGVSGSRAFSNSATADIRVAAGRRINLTGSAGYFDGETGLYAPGSNAGTWSASAQVQVALARMVALHGQYLAYHYDFGSRESLPTGYPAQLDRHAVLAGVTVWMPLFRN